MAGYRIFSGVALASLVFLGACGHNRGGGSSARECMARAMYFESNRSSEDGMLAVGTVVMNRLESGKYPKTVCGVVGQKKQFAPGVLSKPMKESQSRARAEKMAAKVLKGARHRGVGNAMFFHTAGYNFPYTNMHYKVIAGGNAFYEKRRLVAGIRNTTQAEVAMAARSGRSAPDRSSRQAVQMAAAAPSRRRSAPTMPTRSVAFAQAPDVRQVAFTEPAAAEAPAVAPPIAWAPPSGGMGAPDSIEELIFLGGG